MTEKDIYSKRLEHFKGIMEDIQGKTPIYLDDDFLNHLKECMKEPNISPKQKIKRELKKNKMEKYYEFIPTILKKLDIEVIKYSKDDEELLCRLFEEISKQHNIMFPKQTFISYNYLLYKLTEYINHPNLHLIECKKYNDVLYLDKWNKLSQELDWVLIDNTMC